MKDQPGAVSFLFLSIYIFLGVVDCNIIQDHLHAYIYSKVEGKKWQQGGNIDHEVSV